MKISELIRQKLEQRGFRNLKEASAFLGVSPELLRVTLKKDHVPKDKILILIAEKLGLDPAALILDAHREKVPAEVKGFFLSPTEKMLYRKKRKWPLSEEQCDYLNKVLSTEEVQVVRKLRQITDEARSNLLGYLQFIFMTQRKEGFPVTPDEPDESGELKSA